jgi:hypothetical protein
VFTDVRAVRRDSAMSDNKSIQNITKSGLKTGNNKLRNSMARIFEMCSCLSPCAFIVYRN